MPPVSPVPQIAPPDSPPLDPGLVPGQEGTPLWNLQTQKPEWTPLHAVSAKLKSGAYKTYSGSQVPVAAGIGGEAGLDPGRAATALAGGATATHSEATRDLEARKTQYSAQFDNAGDKALAVVDGFVSGLSGNLLDGLPNLSAYAEFVSKKNREEHGNYVGLGELAALAAVVVAPETALKYTPLGATNELFSATAKATSKVLTERVGSTLARRGISEAAGGAVAAGALSTAHSVQQAVQGKPVSPYAVLDDIGLGALIGGGIGLVGGKLSAALSKRSTAQKQIEAAARFDESALPVRGILTDVSKSWNSAHNIAGARVEALDDLVKSGMLDADMPGAEWLKARTTAKSSADKARDTLHKLAGTDDPAAIAARLHDLAVSGKAKDAQKLYKAFDEYGTAVSHLDDVMQPTTYDQAHLHDVIGDIDLAISAKDHPFQRLEQMINNGAPESEIAAFAKQLDDAYAKTATKPGADASAERLRKFNEEGGASAPTRVNKVAKGTPEPGPSSKLAAEKTPYGTVKGDDYLHQSTFERKQGLADNFPEPNMETVKSNLLGGSRAGNEQAGFNAKKLLDQVRAERATGVMSPVRPTELGNRIQGLMDELTAATGNRLGSEEARALATKLGMNTASLNGPVSQKLGDLWSLHRMSEALAESVGGKVGPRSKDGLLTRALKSGVAAQAGSVGYTNGGAFASAAVRSLVSHTLGTALWGAANIAAAGGRMRQSAVNGLAKALHPSVQKAISLGSITKVVSSSYEPGASPTTNYAAKAIQLRNLAQNPEPVTAHLKEALKGVGAVDPLAYTGAVEAGVTRLKNLARALPKNASISVMTRSKGPTDAQIHEFHMYEAVTADRELVFKYMKAGYMPQAVVDAMNEQHPDFMNEIRDYVLNNPDEVQSAPHDAQMALSRLLGVPLVPEAQPEYVARMQEPYIEAKQKAAQAKIQAQGAQALHAIPPTAVQLLTIPR